MVMMSCTKNESPIRIIRDSREQQPLTFSEYNVVISPDKLDAGDYTMAAFDMAGDDYSVIIERKKDCRELATNLVTDEGWRRFLAEAEILAKYKIRQIIVCGPNNFDFLISRKYLNTNISFIYSKIAYLKVCYGVDVLFLNTREEAENYIYRLFRRIMRECERQDEYAG